MDDIIAGMKRFIESILDSQDEVHSIRLGALEEIPDPNVIDPDTLVQEYHIRIRSLERRMGWRTVIEFGLVIVLLFHIVFPHDFFRGEASKILAYALGQPGTPVVAVFDTTPTPPPLPSGVSSGPMGNGTLLPLEELVLVVSPNVDTENVRERYDEVKTLSEKFGYDPAFTMAIWLAESGASNYERFRKVADFGCIGSGRENFEEQINCFLGLWNIYSTGELYATCRGDHLNNRKFLLLFYGGFKSCRENQFIPNPLYPERISKLYSLVTGGGGIDFSGVK